MRGWARVSSQQATGLAILAVHWASSEPKLLLSPAPGASMATVERCFRTRREGGER